MQEAWGKGHQDFNSKHAGSLGGGPPGLQQQACRKPGGRASSQEEGGQLTTIASSPTVRVVPPSLMRSCWERPT